MTSALQISSAERLDSSAPAPGRATLFAPQAGPSFADLLQRGQASHALRAQAATAPPSQTEAAPPEDIPGERGEPDSAEPAPEAPGYPARATAKPALRAREKAPALTTVARGSPQSPSVEDSAIEETHARHAAADNRDGWPPGTLPIAELNEWAASLRPTEPVPTPAGRAAAQPASAAADAVPVLSASDAVPVLSASDGVPALGASDGAIAPGPAENTALFRPADHAILPGPVDDARALVSSNGASANKTAHSVAVLDPNRNAALLKSDNSAAVPSPADGLAGPQPAPGATSGLHQPREAADRDEPRRSGSDGAAATQAARPAAPSPDPAALVSAGRRPATPELPAVRDLVQGLLGGAAGAVPRGFDAATPAPIALPVPLHSPDFAQILGAQVSVLARDGVQQAELHLHPAEMGPISVRISIDDKDARVDFHAPAATTRDVIERGLPELASALREQGLTLAGGGVFQQPPDPRGPPQRQAGGNAGQPRDHAASRGDHPARAMPVPVPQGTLDVYA